MRFLRRALLPLSITLLFVACGAEPEAGRPREGGVAEKPERGGTLVRRLEGDVSTLNFVTSSTLYEKYVLSYLHDGILEWDENLELKGGVASEWSVSENGREFTFVIDSRATFSDGTPVKASDLIFTVATIVDPKSKSVQFAGLFEDIDLNATRAIDERTARVVFRRARAAQIEAFNIPILPEHVYSEGDFAKDYDDVSIGTGPYEMIRFDPGERILLERRDDYWRDEPWIDRVEFRFIEDDTIAWAAMKRGEIDEMRVKSDWWASERDDPEVREVLEFRQFYDLAYNFIAWNFADSILAEKNVRIAMTMALDRSSIIENLYHGTGRVLTGPFTPEQWAYDPDIAPIEFNPTAAAGLLREAGWSDSDGDGTLDRDGVPLRIDILVSSGSQVSGQIGQILQDEAGRLGVRIEVVPLDSSTFFRRILEGDFQAAILGIGVDVDPDVHSLFHSSQIVPNGQNFVAFANDEVDRLIELGRSETNREERVAVYRRLHRILHDEQPYTWVIQASEKWAVNKRIRGVRLGAGLGLYLWHPGPRGWWIEGAPERAAP